mmetsp:Transcript_32020/g.77929  ORF Transcript_32020/g.77929 Transcript_32020/m.77929 type:complete len:867 (+) Transcript_32020:250-2850(+)
MMKTNKTTLCSVAVEVAITAMLLLGSICSSSSSSSTHDGVEGSNHRRSLRRRPQQQQRELQDTNAFFGYTQGPVGYDGTDNSIVFESNTGEEATILSQNAFSGTIDLAVEYTEREFCSDGYQAAVVLFIAPDYASVDSLTTDDNNFGTFEALAVASIKDKLFPTIDFAYFDRRYLGDDGQPVALPQISEGPGSQMIAGSKFRLVRDGPTGQVSFYHYQGTDWNLLGGLSYQLPSEWINRPVRVGIRILRQYQSLYFLKVKPTLLIDGMSKNVAGLPTATTDQLSSDAACTAPVKQCKATGWGDPHLITFDGLKYDVHVKGEVIMMRSMDSPLEVQARLQSPGTIFAGDPAVTTGVAMRDGGTDEVTFPIVQVSIATLQSAAPATVSGCPVELYVDGVPQDVTTYGTSPDGSFEVSIVDGKTIVVEYLNTDLRVESTISFYGICHFSIDYILKTCRSDESIRGLLGTPDDDATNDWHDQNGSVITLPSGGVSNFFFQPAYEYAKANWKVQNADESIFDYEVGQSFDTYADFDEQYDSVLEDLVTTASAEILQLCGDDIGCIIDGETLGLDAAEEYLSNPATERAAAEIPDDDGGGSGSGGARGDPHIKTWTGSSFDFMGECDLVLARGDKFGNGLGFEVQIRTEISNVWSFISAAAIRIGNDILEVDSSGHHYVNGVGGLDPITDKQALETVFPISWRMEYVGKHTGQIYTINLHGDNQQEQEHDEEANTFVIKVYNGFIDVEINGGDSKDFGDSVGLMGDFHTGSHLARDHRTVVVDDVKFGLEWQVLGTERMLFQDIGNGPQHPTQCMMPSQSSLTLQDRRLSVDPEFRAKAERACAAASTNDVDACVFDVLATGDLGMAGSYLL